jgi:hypothetical protein
LYGFEEEFKAQVDKVAKFYVEKLQHFELALMHTESLLYRMVRHSSCFIHLIVVQMTGSAQREPRRINWPSSQNMPVPFNGSLKSIQDRAQLISENCDIIGENFIQLNRLAVHKILKKIRRRCVSTEIVVYNYAQSHSSFWWTGHIMMGAMVSDCTSILQTCNRIRIRQSSSNGVV